MHLLGTTPRRTIARYATVAMLCAGCDTIDQHYLDFMSKARKAAVARYVRSALLANTDTACVCDSSSMLVDALMGHVSNGDTLMDATVILREIRTAFHDSSAQFLPLMHGWPASHGGNDAQHDAGPSHGDDRSARDTVKGSTPKHDTLAPKHEDVPGPDHTTRAGVVKWSVPPLWRVLFCEGFTYELTERPLDDHQALFITGTYVYRYGDDKHKEEDVRLLALRERLMMLSNLARLDQHCQDSIPSYFTKDHGRLSENKLEHSYAAMDRRYGKPFSWLHERLPYATAYSGCVEVNVHTYVEDDPDAHRMDLVVQIALVRLENPEQ